MKELAARYLIHIFNRKSPPLFFFYFFDKKYCVEIHRIEFSYAIDSGASADRRPSAYRAGRTETGVSGIPRLGWLVILRAGFRGPVLPALEERR
jgi:hypothetical protein